MSYDANGNMLSYDADGPGLEAARTLIYDGENRPIAVIRNGVVTIFAYGPDGERAAKIYGQAQTIYLGNDREKYRDQFTPQWLHSAYLHADVRREGTATDYLLKDHLSSNRLTLRQAPASTRRHDYSPFGQPLSSNGAEVPAARGYINERFDAETGLHYLHARYYDPLLGRFITPFGGRMIHRIIL